MLVSIIIDAIIASILAFLILCLVLFVFGNLFVRREKRLLNVKEIRKEIHDIISEERE